jgi:hypothetical protein
MDLVVLLFKRLQHDLPIADFSFYNLNRSYGHRLSSKCWQELFSLEPWQEIRNPNGDLVQVRCEKLVYVNEENAFIFPNPNSNYYSCRAWGEMKFIAHSNNPDCLYVTKSPIRHNNNNSDIEVCVTSKTEYYKEQLGIRHGWWYEISETGNPIRPVAIAIDYYDCDG